ncbi:MAG: DNA gyrase inhibitor YacG [Alphaproteobacteria bacterium]|nr:DNA gyrase inhibitor YacG [Alphaproteobacteria bacterium]
MSNTAKRCPLCGQKLEKASDVFCSERCSLIDLGNWLGEKYAVPAEPDDEDGLGLEDDSAT